MAGLSAKQLQAVYLLTAGKSEKLTASEVGVTPKTICVWLKQPEFRAEIEQQLVAQKDRVEAKLGVLAENSAVVIQQVLQSGDDSIRVQAAKAVLQSYARISNRLAKTQNTVIAPLIVISNSEGPKEA